MKLLVTFRQPGMGFYKMYLASNELLRFTRGRARREPASKDAMTKSVPIKYITSIHIVGADETTCSACKKPSAELLCLNCIGSVARSNNKH